MNLGWFGVPAAEMTSSRSGEMNVAVGFNPRFADEHASAVA